MKASVVDMVECDGEKKVREVVNGRRGTFSSNGGAWTWAAVVRRVVEPRARMKWSDGRRVRDAMLNNWDCAPFYGDWRRSKNWKSSCDCDKCAGLFP